MNLADRFAAHPELAIGGCITWAFLALWIVSMIHWMVQGEIDAGYGIIGVFLGFGLGILAINPPEGSEFLTPVVMFAVVITVVLFVPLRSAINRHELVSIDMEAISRAYGQLEERPNNVGAKFKIAKLVYNRGLHGHAIKLADDALKGMPSDFFGEEHKLVDMWKRQGHDSASFRALPCVECGNSNPPGEIYCKKCGAKFLLDQAKGKWLGRAMVRKLMAGWVAMLGVSVGIPLCATALPPAAAMVAILGLAVLIVILLYSAFIGNQLRRA
ncbi:MAG: hypothetical protein QOJ65_662 [Fimbriimonadaceae bacterium]|nr:hypothetical protein [Fimbriimonadaceae bacterium]